MIGIFSACYSECKTLIQLLDARPSELKENLWVADGIEGVSFVIGVLGVGYLTAGVELQRILNCKLELDSVVFLGTAGIYPRNSEYQIGGHYSCSEVILTDAASVLGKGDIVEPVKQGPIVADTQLQLSDKALRVASPLSITTDQELALEYEKQHHVQLENMELFGIAMVASDNNISWNALLGATNFVGEGGREEWLDNHSQVEEITSNLLFQQLNLLGNNATSND